jgi:hypothetical protein
MDRKSVMHDLALSATDNWNRYKCAGMDEGAMWQHIIYSFAHMSDRQVADVAAVHSSETVWWDEDHNLILLRLEDKYVSLRNI